MKDKFLNFKDYYERRYNVKTKLTKTLKNNSVLVGFYEITDNNISPVIYLNDFLKDDLLENEIIAEKIKKIFEENSNTDIIENYYLEKIKNFDEIKDFLTFKLINRKNNLEYLNEVIYTEFLDLAKVFLIEFETDDNSRGATINVNNSLLQLWNKTKEEIEKNCH